LPKNCELKQIAIQIRNPDLFDKRYVINQDLWNSLDTDNQAALVLHEIIYRMAIEQGASDSVGARLINSLIFSDTVSNLDWITSIKAWEKAGYTQLILGDLKMGIGPKTPLTIDANGFVTGHVIQDQKCLSPIDSEEYDCLKLGSDELLGTLYTSNDWDFKYNPASYENTFSGSWTELYLGAPNTKFRVSSNNVPTLADLLNPGGFNPFQGSLVATVIYKTNSSCIYNADQSTNALPYKVLIQKTNGTTYKTVFNPGDYYCFNSQGDLIP
jgi:hypothetical protein